MAVARAVVRVCGTEYALAPGALVGRAAGAACLVSDAGVSEAHALLSLRGRQFLLLSLRGALVVQGESETDVPLTEGLEQLPEALREQQGGEDGRADHPPPAGEKTGCGGSGLLFGRQTP